MEKRADGVTEVEAGDEILVVTAKHLDGSTALVGSFTSYRLASIGSKAYSMLSLIGAEPGQGALRSMFDELIPLLDGKPQETIINVLKGFMTPEVIMAVRPQENARFVRIMSDLRIAFSDFA